MPETALGRFIRARREQVAPTDVGLPDGARRRTPGLRREELALLAGISIDYLVRLEQGRDQHPSAQVVEALARALRLTDDAAAHLHALAEPPRALRRRPRRRPERVEPRLARLLDAWTDRPAVIFGRHLDVLAANPLAVTLSPAFAVGRNVLRALFLDLECREQYPDWEDVAAGTVASLRASVGPDLDDPRLTELVGELSLKSEDFGRLWARHDVHAKVAGRKRFRNPLVGELALDYDTLAVTGSPGQLLVVYSAAPGSPDEQALTLLAALADRPHALT